MAAVQGGYERGPGAGVVKRAELAGLVETEKERGWIAPPAFFFRWLLRCKLPEDVLQDPAVLVVLDFLRRVDAHLGVELLHAAVG